MIVLAILGPRSRPRVVARFQQQSPGLAVLQTPDTTNVRESLANAGLVAIFGGDGTLNRHLSALVEAQVPVLMVPTGSGNDFALAHGLKRPQEALRVFAEFCAGSGRVVSADLGRVELASPQGESIARYFSCCANVGLDADAAARTNALPNFLKARGGYFLGGLGAVLSYQPQWLQLTSAERSFADKAWFVSVSNTPTYGGGLKIAPQASLTDGLLDITLVNARHLGRAALARHFPKILSGRHVGVKEVETYRTTEVLIETGSKQPIYADGEFLGYTPCRVNVCANALRVLQ